MRETIRANALFRHNNWKASLILNNTSIHSRLGLEFKAEEDSQTGWVRRGMPREQIPVKKEDDLHLNINGLKDGCSQSHAMPSSNLQRISGLEVSKPTLFPFITGNYTSNGVYSLAVWLLGNKTRLGAISHGSSGYCSDMAGYRLCVRRESSRKHEVARYVRISTKSSWYYSKKFNFSVEGDLSDTDAMDIAIQSDVETHRVDFMALEEYDLNIQRRVANLIESGRVLSGLVRVVGKGIPGRSMVRKDETATINIFGIVGVAILTGLVLIPIPMILNIASAL